MSTPTVCDLCGTTNTPAWGAKGWHEIPTKTNHLFYGPMSGYEQIDFDLCRLCALKVFAPLIEKRKESA